MFPLQVQGQWDGFSYQRRTLGLFWQLSLSFSTTNLCLTSTTCWDRFPQVKYNQPSFLFTWNLFHSQLVGPFLYWRVTTLLQEARQPIIYRTPSDLFHKRSDSASIQVSHHCALRALSTSVVTALKDKFSTFCILKRYFPLSSFQWRFQTFRRSVVKYRWVHEDWAWHPAQFKASKEVPLVKHQFF